MPHPLIMEAPEVAALLGVALATLPHKVRRLRRTANFPAPLPGRPDAWSRARIEEWVQDPEGGQVRRPVAEARLARQREALEARYAGGAA